MFWVMGTDTFIEQPNLPGVRSEIEYIRNNWQSSEPIFRDEFTLSRLEQEINNGYRVLHLATHGEFNAGAPSNSFIQFSKDETLTLQQVRNRLPLRTLTPSVDLLVLSACQTALGSREAELGFAGFAFQSGARSVLASLQRVPDAGTAGLITQFYQQLREQPTKAEALRHAQLRMINGEVYIQNGYIVWGEEESERVRLYGVRSPAPGKAVS